MQKSLTLLYMIKIFLAKLSYENLCYFLAIKTIERNSYVRIRLKIAATDGFKEELCASDNVVFACWKKRDREEELQQG